MNTLLFAVFALLASAAHAFSASARRSDVLTSIYVPPNAGTLPELATELGDTTLVELVKKAGLADALSGAGPFTLFAPTNQAFKNLPPKLLEYMEKNVTFLASVLKYHVLSSVVYSSQLTNDLTAPTLNGKSIRANLYKDDTVVTINGAKVVLANQNASNGVLHQIDKVLLPPGGNLVDLVSGCPKLKDLTEAVVKAELAATLSGDGPFTLFAPMDSAFAKLPPGVLDGLLNNITALKNVLTYHVLGKTLYSAGLEDGTVTALNGGTIKVQIQGADVVLNDNVKVILADVAATNGVAHAIDTVLIPQSMSFTEIVNKPRPLFTHLFK